MLPISLVQFLPKFYFTLLLMVFGIEIPADWLFYSYTKVPPSRSCRGEHATWYDYRHAHLQVMHARLC